VRATSKIGEFTRDSSLPPKFRSSLADACNAGQAQETGGALAHEGDLAATRFPLSEKSATYPVEYAKRAGELIARRALVEPAKAKIAEQ
jgi:hypothetical protein